MKLGISIMGIPQRKRYVEQYIAPRLREVDTKFYHVSYDFKRLMPWRHLRKIYSVMLLEDLTHFAIFQDDVVVHPDIAIHLPKVARLATDTRPLIGLFTPNRKQFNEGEIDGNLCGIKPDELLWGQAHVATREFVEGVIEVDKLLDRKELEKASYHDDYRFTLYCKKQNIDRYIVYPSLVRHNLTIKSSIGTPSHINHIKRDTRQWDTNLPEDYFDEARIC